MAEHNISGKTRTKKTLAGVTGILIVMLLLFSNLGFVINGKMVKRDMDTNSRVGGYEHPLSWSSKEETRSSYVILSHDDFNEGAGNFTPDHNSRAGIYIGEEHDGDSVAMEGNSVFFRGLDDGPYGEFGEAEFFTIVNLSDTDEVILEFDYAYEDMDVWGFYCDLFTIDIDADGMPGGDWSNVSWAIPPMRSNNGDHQTTVQDYVHIEYDLSSVPKLDEIGLRFYCRFQDGNNGQYRDPDLVSIDNVTIKANYRPHILDKDEITPAPSSIYTLTNDITQIEFDFLDPMDEATDTFSVSLDVRLADDITILNYVDNISITDPRLSIEKLTGVGEYSATLEFEPSVSYGFGYVDFAPQVFNYLELSDRVSFGELENVLELLDHDITINSSSINSTIPAINGPEEAAVTIFGEFQDMDDQPVEDFGVSLWLRDEQGATYALHEDITCEMPELNISKETEGNYRFELTWDPDDSYPASTYDILLNIDDGYICEDEVSYDTLNNVFEVFDARISATQASPFHYNQYTQEPLYLNFTVELNAGTGHDLWNDLVSSKMNISLRNAWDQTYTIHAPVGESNHTNEIEKITVDENTFIISYKYELAYELPAGIFDVRVDFEVEDTPLLTTRYSDNQDIFETYFNIGPGINSIYADSGLLNIFKQPTVILTAEIQDKDLPPLEMITMSLMLKNDEEPIFNIFDNVTIHSQNVELAREPDENGTYSVNFFLNINESFTPGTYDIQVDVWDEFRAQSRLSFAQGNGIFDLYHNEPPSPPTHLYPNETSEQTPLIHWYGANDLTTSSADITYSIRIGTAEGEDDVLEWFSVGKNTFYKTEDLLDYGTYYVEVVANDGLDDSEPLMDSINIFALANTPPTPPSEIRPDYTLETLPLITWKGANDGDGDTSLNNFIQIGTQSHGNDIKPWTSVGTANQYQVENKLELGTYYIQIKVSDGKEMSYVQQEMLYVISEGNVPPSPPTEIYPESTWDAMPNITWAGAYDYNEDALTYQLQIGTEPGKGDVLSWIENLPHAHYQIKSELSIGLYYVQIKAFDGEMFSPTFEGVLDITEIGNAPPSAVSNISPETVTNSTPLIEWENATDSDGENENIIYFIQIGFTIGHGDFLSWFSTGNDNYYQVSRELSPNQVYYVQIKAFDGEDYSKVRVGTLELLVYLWEINFDRRSENITVVKGITNQFNLTIVCTGTAPDLVATIELECDDELKQYLEGAGQNVTLSRGRSERIVITLTIPEDSTVEGNFTITAICSSTFYTARTTALKFSVVEAEKISGTLQDREPLILAGIVMLLIIILVSLIFMIRRRMDRVPDELLERDEKAMMEEADITFSPDTKKGMVKKHIIPEAKDIFTNLLQLPGGDGLKSEKKQLALPQHSVVIDMGSQRIIGHTETGAQKDVKAIEDILEFENTDGKYEMKRGLLPDTTYGKSSPNTPVKNKPPYGSLRKDGGIDMVSKKAEGKVSNQPSSDTNKDITPPAPVD